MLLSNTPSEPLSEGTEGHSGGEGKREEYFGEPRPTPVRRSARIAPQPPPRREGTRDGVTPQVTIDVLWVESEGGAAIRVWHVMWEGQGIAYHADGTLRYCTLKDLAPEELTNAQVARK